jgi:hypothetical protein
MEAAEILEKARAGGEHPPDWVILPLLRNKVMLGIAGWVLGAIVGLGLFAAMVPIMIPHNYFYGFIAALFSTLVLGIMLFVGIGSIWQIIVDTGRLLQADKHVIVITPEDFVMQKGGKIIHVPLMYVRHITARGTPPPDRTAPTDAVVSNMPHSSENLTSFIFGRGLIPSGRRMFSRRKRVPTLLAFVDSRTNTQVKVTDNNSYGDPLKIASILRENTTRVQHIV